MKRTWLDWIEFQDHPELDKTKTSVQERADSPLLEFRNDVLKTEMGFKIIDFPKQLSFHLGRSQLCSLEKQWWFSELLEYYT